MSCSDLDFTCEDPEQSRVRSRANALYNEAISLEDEGKPEEAISKYREAIKVCAENPLFSTNDLGLIATRNNLAALLLARATGPTTPELEEARDLYQQSIDADPYSIIAA